MANFIGDDNVDWTYMWETGKDIYPGFDYEPAAVFDYALQYLPKEGRVLEIGCGFARWSPLWRKLGFVYEGVDGSEYAISEAQRRYPGSRFRNCTVQEFPADQALYDVIFSNTFMQHTNLEHKRQIFTMLHKVLRDNGVLMMQEKCDVETPTTFTREGWIRFIEPFGFRYMAGTVEEDPRNGFVFKKI